MIGGLEKAEEESLSPKAIEQKSQVVHRMWFPQSRRE
jgi:hypothetical protein